ncbi:hypothetical protein QT327_16825 [Olivibacter sp. 47]|uniref:hypothetical protein n=1 Tax=Olivibacter sp. 47 TaxID=3056486 RepID=UPI0025A3C8CB|nr:hypothetical protein [Olivibacter sp. 47]MDM8175992.1 hypothetical protein [Olivibacter sp. 47]
MEEQKRIFLADILFRIDPIFGRFIQVGNPDNEIHFDSLQDRSGYYSTVIDKAKFQIDPATDGETPSEIQKINIPEAVIYGEYEEGSDYAQNFNKEYIPECNIRLVDRETLAELEEYPLTFKHRHLPTIDIGGFEYEIDVSFDVLRQKEDPLSVIEFCDMEKEEQGYSFVFDRESQLINYFEEGVEDRIKIHLPEMVELDPEGMSLKYGVPVEKLPEKDKDLECSHQMIHHRIHEGNLSVIRIVDKDYYVDLRMGQLRATDQFWKTIDLNRTEEARDSSLLFAYNYHRHELVDIDENITAYPKNTVLVALPHDSKLDPVGAGRKDWGDELALLDQYPIQQRMEARIFPLEKIKPIAEMIEENLKKQQVKQDRKKGRRM